ncbi:MAG: hypothetical protein KDA58_07250 [Planctomycetaceae bacterium]|nr:hypothetical protein [Planctomycetaceae bacterium]
MTKSFQRALHSNRSVERATQNGVVARICAPSLVAAQIERHGLCWHAVPRAASAAMLPLICTITLICAAHDTAQAQSIRSLELEEAKPAFQVEPVVQRLTGRRGQQLPFEFELTSLVRSTNVEVRAVAMMQEESGAILPDDQSPPPTAIRLLSPPRMTLAEDASETIRGTIQIPPTNSPFHLFGILVTDFGTKLPDANRQPTTDGAELKVEFVTRYLLRIEIDVDGVRPTDISKLVLESAELRDLQGYPQLSLLVTNPTEAPFEFEIECELHSPVAPADQRSFQLGMPVRAALAPPEKYVARILPGAKIRMQEIVPFALFPGPYKLETKLVAQRRKWHAVEFDLNAAERGYPGQEAMVRQLGPGLSAAPVQMELSLQSGGARFVSTTLANNSAEPVTFTLEPRDLAGHPADWFTVRPASIELQPGSSRKVLVSASSGRTLDGDLYGQLIVNAQSESGTIQQTTPLDVLLVSRQTGEPKLEVGSLAWGDVDGSAAVILPVTNSGNRHAQLEARMSLINNETGRKFDFAAGHGKWLLPAASRDLIFPVTQRLPPGGYELKIQMRAAVDAPVMQLKTAVEIGE